MSDVEFNLYKFILDILQFLVVLGTAIWAVYRFRRERTHTPRIDFTIECNFFGPVKDEYIAEFILSLINKGSVIHEPPGITLTIRGLNGDSELSFWEKHGQRVNFPYKLLDKERVELMGERVFEEPGTKLDMPYATKIHQSYKYILARANIQYTTSRRHGVEKIFEVSTATK